jgi:CheY-like chemotaxis protein
MHADKDSAFNGKLISPMTITCLILEDHAISREFLTQALNAFPCNSKSAETLSEALKLVKSYHFDLWICDMHLPDAEGIEILNRIRLAAPSEAKNTKAIAITADLVSDVSAELIAAGFDEVLGKPMSIAELHAAIRRVGIPTFHHLNTAADTLWDIEAAMKTVGGNETSMQALRDMFLNELPSQMDCVEKAFNAKNSASLKTELHKLMAGCGFVGAARLQGKVNALAVSPFDQAHLQHFLDTAKQYLMKVP